MLKELSKTKQCDSSNIAVDERTSRVRSDLKCSLTVICLDCEAKSLFTYSNEAIQWGKTKAETYPPNYTLLCFLLNGQSYKDYSQVLRMAGLPSMSEKQWRRVIECQNSEFRNRQS